MTLAREILHGAAIGVGVADCVRDLDVIARPGVAAALWQRRVDPGWQAWINGIAPETLPQLRVILHPGRVRDAVSDACDVAGLDASAARDWLIEDIPALADRFAGLMRARFLRLRLDVIETDACRRFHIDAVTARLICTYRRAGCSPRRPARRCCCAVRCGRVTRPRGCCIVRRPSRGAARHGSCWSSIRWTTRRRRYERKEYWTDKPAPTSPVS